MTDLFLAFLEISLPVSLMIVLLLLLTPLFDRRYAARWKYWVWIVLAARLLFPFGGGSGGTAAELRPQGEIPAMAGPAPETKLGSGPELEPGSASEANPELEPEPAPEAEPERGQTAPETPAAEAPRGRVIVALPAQMTAPIAAQPEDTGNRISWLDLIAGVWVSGSVAMMCVPLGSYLLYRRRLRKKGSAVQDEAVLRLLRKLKGELQIRSAVSVIGYPEASSPMLTGFLRPVLVLPKAQYSAEELSFILKHELVHLKRGDLYCKLLFEAVRAVYWWNPLVWVMQREAAVDMELSCDERVIKDLGYPERKAYAEALLSALQKQSAKKTALSTNFYGGKRIMKKRFQNILTKTEKKNGAAVFVCAVILAMSLGTLVGCSVIPGSPNPAAPSGTVNPAGAANPSGTASPAEAANSSGTANPAGAANPSGTAGSPGANNMQEGNTQSDPPLPGTPDAAPAAAAFLPGMGCSDPACTDAAHHHDCPADCADYEHHHACALDCTEAGHHHGTAASNAPGSSGNSGNSGASGHHSGHSSGHHADAHHS